MDVDNDMNTGLSLADPSAENPVPPRSNGEGSIAEWPDQPCPESQRPSELEARLWFKARKNLMLLYNGGRPASERA